MKQNSAQTLLQANFKQYHTLSILLELFSLVEVLKDNILQAVRIRKMTISKEMFLVVHSSCTSTKLFT